MKKDEVKIIITPFHSEIIKTETGFEWHFFGATNEGKGKAHEIVIKFKIWWIPYLLEQIVKLVDEKIDYLKDIRNKINL